MELTNVNSRLDVCRSTSERVCEILRQAVWNHTLTAGERLVEAKLAKSLEISITPLRQAFILLTKEGLLTSFPYKGTYVTYITKEYCQDVLFVRRQLEPAVCEAAFPKITSDDIKHLKGLCSQSDHYYRQGDKLEAIHYDILFHEFFFKKAGSALMLEMWNILKNRVIAVQSYTKMAEVEKDYMIKRHGKIIGALEMGDLEEAVRCLIAHLETSVQNYDFPSAEDVEYR